MCKKDVKNVGDVKGIIYIPFNYNYTYNLKYLKICARYKLSYCTRWQAAIVFDEVSSDFHGVTLQAGLAGLCPINIRILVRGGALLLYQLRYGLAV